MHLCVCVRMCAYTYQSQKHACNSGSYLNVSCSELSTERAMDLKNPFTAEQPYEIVGLSDRALGSGDLSCDKLEPRPISAGETTVSCAPPATEKNCVTV